MYYRGIQYNVILLGNAEGGLGSVWHNSDDSYTIFIDAKLNRAKQKEVFMQEMNHIKNNDFEKEDVQEIEHKAHL